MNNITADGAWRLTDYFKGEHRRVVAALETHSATMPEGARLHLNWIKNHPDATTFTERDISVTYAPNKGYSPAMMADGRAWLHERNAILRMSSTVRPEGTPGVKPSPKWQIHPDLRSTTETTHSTESPGEVNPAVHVSGHNGQNGQNATVHDVPKVSADEAKRIAEDFMRNF